jgi:hypothetical protein
MKYLIESDETGKVSLVELLEQKITKDLLSRDKKIFVASGVKEITEHGLFFNKVFEDRETAEQVYDTLVNYRKHLKMCVLNRIIGLKNEEVRNEESDFEL